MDCRQCVYSEIANSAAGVFQGQSVKRIAAKIFRLVDVSRKANVGIFLQIFHAHADLFAVPQMPQHAEAVRHKLIFGIVGLYTKKP